MTHCAHDAEVVRAVLSGRWPGECDASLREHVEGCKVCSEVAAIASVLADDRFTVRRDVVVPAAGQVWWRAAVRARLEATHAAARPLTWLYTVAAVLLVTGTAIALTMSVDRARGLFEGIASRLSVHTPDITPVATSLVDLATWAIQRGLPLVIALAFCLLAAPIALYLALHDE